MTVMRTLSVAAVLAALTAPALAADLHLTTLEWPPYSGAGLTDMGASVAVARAAAEASGDALKVEVLPWQRAVQTGLEQPGYVGYFPEYHSAELEATCAFSDSLGDSPLGLVERAAEPVAWQTLDDLKPHVIGTVQGYVNTADFDAMAASGALKVEPVVDDLTNLRKVGGGRIPAAVIDRNVMAYLLKHEASLADAAGVLQFNGRLLENKTLHVCFRKDADGLAARDRFNAGLAKIDRAAVAAGALN